MEVERPHARAVEPEAGTGRRSAPASQSPRRLRPWILGSIGLLLLAAVFCAGPAARAWERHKGWRAIARSAEGNLQKLVGKVPFEDGGWISLYHHASCCSPYCYHDLLVGDFTLGLSSDGTRIDCDYHFCGYEGLSCYHHDFESFKNLQDYLSQTAECGWQVIEKGSVKPMQRESDL